MLQSKWHDKIYAAVLLLHDAIAAATAAAAFYEYMMLTHTRTPSPVSVTESAVTCRRRGGLTAVTATLSQPAAQCQWHGVATAEIARVTRARWTPRITRNQTTIGPWHQHRQRRANNVLMNALPS